MSALEVYALITSISLREKREKGCITVCVVPYLTNHHTESISAYSLPFVFGGAMVWRKDVYAHIHAHKPMKGSSYKQIMVEYSNRRSAIKYACQRENSVVSIRCVESREQAWVIPQLRMHAYLREEYDP